MDRSSFANVANNILIARHVWMMVLLVLNAKEVHIYTEKMDKMFVVIAIPLAIVKHALKMVVIHAKIAL